MHNVNRVKNTDTHTYRHFAALYTEFWVTIWWIYRSMNKIDKCLIMTSMNIFLSMNWIFMVKISMLLPGASIHLKTFHSICQNLPPCEFHWHFLMDEMLDESSSKYYHENIFIQCMNANLNSFFVSTTTNETMEHTLKMVIYVNWYISSIKKKSRTHTHAVSLFIDYVWEFEYDICV